MKTLGNVENRENQTKKNKRNKERGKKKKEKGKVRLQKRRHTARMGSVLGRGRTRTMSKRTNEMPFETNKLYRSDI